MSSFLNGIIRFSLRNRMLVAALATFVLLYGGWQVYRLPIDVFPQLNRPRVVVMTEAPGLAPEEVESLVTFPIESKLSGAHGVQAVRTSSAVGISVAYVEFDWGTDIYTDRQIVAERLASAREQLPKGIVPQLAPISSIMGQIMIVGMYSRPNRESLLCSIDGDDERLERFVAELDVGVLPADVKTAISGNGASPEISSIVGGKGNVQVEQPGARWRLSQTDDLPALTLLRGAQQLEVHRTTSPMQLRTLADWVVRQQLLAVPGVSQVFVMGGQRKQFQVLINPDLLVRYGVTLEEAKLALSESNQNATGGYLDEQGPNEYLVRVLGRIASVRELAGVVVKHREGRSILLGQIAKVVEGPQVQRGDSAAFERQDDGRFTGGPAVVLTINKQPGADTRQVTDEIVKVLGSMQGRLPPDVSIASELYQQKAFIDLAIENVRDALRDGGLLVVVILFLFLLNFRTTFITLTAIPLSLVVTGLVFQAFDLTINTMTLGGLAVAIGELVDDAIVDVENIFRRLRENRDADRPLPPLLVVYRASLEVRNSIVFGTMIVVLVFIPLFALSGIEGRLFTPLGIAYIVSILSSLLVSLTVTPVLSYWLLSGKPAASHERDGLLLRFLKRCAGGAISASLTFAVPVLLLAGCAVGIAGLAVWNLENDFLPPFDEGAVQVNVLMPPGTSLRESNRVASTVDRRLQEIEDIRTLVRKTGRAELDEHAEGVNVSEIVATIDPDSPRDREEVLEEIRETLAGVPGIVVSVEQPLAHLISHMLSGVKAQVAIKLYGEELEVLRRQAELMKDAIADVPGVKDLQVEPQTIIPQMRIEIDGEQLQQYGLTRGDISRFVETAMNGDVVSEVLQGNRKYDLLIRLDEPFREDLDTLNRLTIQLPGGGTTSLGAVAHIYRAGGPNTINREKVQRRIVLQCNVGERGLVDVVRDIEKRLEPIESALPDNYFMELGGQFESQQSASRTIGILFTVSLAGMVLVLYSIFRSVNLSLQVMVALPMAFIGSVAALYLTGQTLTVAAMVGFISLCGIASRNGILLINHYLHLVRREGEDWTREMIVRAGRERLAPVLMTALTSGIGLLPLALAAGEPGKEILYPVATVIIGGLVSSTLLEFLVRPALFWQFGRSAGQRLLRVERTEVTLDVPRPESQFSQDGRLESAK